MLALASPAQATVYPDHMLKRIHHNVSYVWRYQDLMGKPRRQYHAWAENKCGNLNCIYTQLKIWRGVKRYTRYRFNSWHDRRGGISLTVWNNLLCIHSHEGSWSDPNSPYWGGMQMDINFMRGYGPTYYRLWGTADHWPPFYQLVASGRAVRSRGYGPWPSTRYMCGI